MVDTSAATPRSITRRQALVAAGIVCLPLAWPLRAKLRRTAGTAGRELRFWAGRPARRQAAGDLRHLPAPSLDPVVADRVRTALVGLERRWDGRHVHVDAEDHVVVLHGEVPSARAARTVEAAALRVPGVAGVESYLHVGPVTDGSQPSPGMRYPEPSDARRRLLHAVYAAGAPAELTLPIVRGVLGLVADRIPSTEVARLTAHLPRDVTALCQRPTRNGQHRRPVRSVDDIVADLGPVVAPLGSARARRVVEAVLRTLHELSPEDTSVAATALPGELRAFWLTPRVAAPHTV